MFVSLTQNLGSLRMPVEDRVIVGRMKEFINHMAQASLFDFTAVEVSGICKAADSLRGLGTQNLTRAETPGVALAAEEILADHARKRRLGFPGTEIASPSLLKVIDGLAEAGKWQLSAALIPQK